MTLVELLDKIDVNAPHACQTCRHCGTHAKCNIGELGGGCLGPIDSGIYRNWEPGNALRDLHAAQVAGIRNIVIGGCGEADFSATSSPESVAKHLHYVSEECGYMCEMLATTENGKKITISTSNGTYTVYWDKENKLEKITDAITGKQDWPLF